MFKGFVLFSVFCSQQQIFGQNAKSAVPIYYILHPFTDVQIRTFKLLENDTATPHAVCCVYNEKYHGSILVALRRQNLWKPGGYNETINIQNKYRINRF
jgi:hypothetical protein